MATSVTMPRIGFTMETGTIAGWLKEVGEEVQAGEPLVEVLTDKATVEVEAPTTGILLKIVAHKGEVVPVTGIIGYIGTADEDIALLVEQPADSYRESAGDGSCEVVSESQLQPSQETHISGEINLRLSPRARLFAKENNLSDDQIKFFLESYGSRAKLTERELREFLSKDRQNKIGSQKTKVIFTPIEKLTGERMLLSVSTAPQYFLEVEVDVSRLKEVKKSMSITFTDLIVRALAKVLHEHPRCNATWDGDELYLNESVNMGVAVSSPKGLIVPVLHQVEMMDFTTQITELRRLVDAARSGKIRPDDVSGGTFTFSNLGMYGVERFSAILNPPQVAILASGSINNQITGFSDDMVAIRPMLNLTLTLDHRAIDGAMGAMFLTDLKRHLEEPEMLSL